MRSRKNPACPHRVLAAIVAAIVLSIAGSISAAPGVATGRNAPVPSAPTSVFRLFHPTFIRDFYGYQSAIYVQNPNDVAATLALTFYGTTQLTLQTTLAPGAVLSYERGEPAQLPDGVYRLLIESDQSLTSVVEVYRSTGDRIAAYRGMSETSASTAGAYRAFYTPVFDSGGIMLWNIGYADATVEVELFQPNGTPVTTGQTYHIAPTATLSLTGPQLGLAPGYYSAVVTSNQPLVGQLQIQTAGVPPAVFELRPGVIEPATQAYLPRAQKLVDEGGGRRTTQLYVANAGTAATPVTITFVNASGVGVYTHQIPSLPVAGTTLLDLAALQGLSSGTFSVRVTALQPLALGEITTFVSSPTSTYVATYGQQQGSSGFVMAPANAEAPGHMLNDLPRLVNTIEEYSIVSIHNLAPQAADAVIDFYNQAGLFVWSSPLSLPAEGSSRLDLRQSGPLAGFTGSARLYASEPLAVLADQFYVACTPPANVQVVREPSGDLYPGDAVEFTASATGDQPFSYNWTVDGMPEGSNKATLDYSFDTAGSHDVGVAVSNACGEALGMLPVNVLPPPAPDLSTSSKIASQNAVNAGDRVTYTLLLRNTGDAPASATLTDPIPMYETYVVGSAHASDGVPVTYAGGVLQWAGQMAPGVVVSIEYAADVQPAPIGAAIENVASLSDGAGHTTSLRATSKFNPGFGLTINEGALATNSPWVALRYSWNAATGITLYQVSNDGGFPPGASTAWIPVNAANPTHSPWQLTTLGDLRMPRTVYIRFRDASGNPFGPYQDDIILDQTPPQISGLSIVPLPAAAANPSSDAGSTVAVRVTSSDDNSGVAEVQLSNRSDFAGASAYRITGVVTEIVWMLQPSGLVYARVFDRAGNASPPASAQGETSYLYVYLPMLSR